MHASWAHAFSLQCVQLTNMRIALAMLPPNSFLMCNSCLYANLYTQMKLPSATYFNPKQLHTVSGAGARSRQHAYPLQHNSMQSMLHSYATQAHVLTCMSVLTKQRRSLTLTGAYV